MLQRYGFCFKLKNVYKYLLVNKIHSCRWLQVVAGKEFLTPC